MNLHITTLTDNIAGVGNTLAEWGLSILVEADETTILLDTGKTTTAVHNADALGIDLSKIDKIILSHGHNDHTGGLFQVLHRIGKEVEIIAHPDVWGDQYAHLPEGKDVHTGIPLEKDEYIGIPFRRQQLESLGASFNLTAKPVKITENIMTTGEIPMVTEFEEVDPILFIKGDNGWQPDKLKDDLAIVLNTEQGLIIILGCAHRGIINTIYHAQQLTGVKPVHMVLGGSHLISASEERLWLTIAALKELGVQRLGLSHCTGLPVISLLAQEFGDKFFFNTAGTSLSLP